MVWRYLRQAKNRVRFLQALQRPSNDNFSYNVVKLSQESRKYSQWSKQKAFSTSQAKVLQRQMNKWYERGRREGREEETKGGKKERSFPILSFQLTLSPRVDKGNVGRLLNHEFPRVLMTQCFY